MRVLRSPLLEDVRHGFSTRTGGVSTGRFASLNLGGKWGDDPVAVVQNRRRLADFGGFDLERLFAARQVHGAACVSTDGRFPADVAGEAADALVTTEPGSTVGVYTADCVPILFSDGAGYAAAAHAGWRGTILGVGPAALESMVAAGAKRESVRAALGPSIGPCCFAVGEEVAEAFEALVPDSVLRLASRQPRVDLWRANAVLLERAGLPPANLDARPLCTVCHPELFFSFRRDGGGIGQMFSYVQASPR